MRTLIAATALLSLAAPASAQYYSASNDPAPGAQAIMNADYSTAEREIRGSDLSKFDPARAINLGVVLAQTGRTEKAIKNFEMVLREPSVDVITASGKTMSSHDIALRALADLQVKVSSR